MTPPYSRERRDNLMAQINRVETAAARPPQPRREPPPRAPDNPFDAASAHLAARWDRMKADCEEAMERAKVAEQENAHLRERVRSLSDMLDQQEAHFGRLLEHHVGRADEAVQALATIRARFGLIRDAISETIKDPLLIGTPTAETPQQKRGTVIEVADEKTKDWIRREGERYDEPPAAQFSGMVRDGGESEDTSGAEVKSILDRLAPVTLMRR